MSYDINVQADPPYTGSAGDVRKAAEETLKHVNAPAGSLSVILTDEKTLQAANRQYAGIDETTDVLSFSDGEKMPDAEGIYFGDILIAVPVAEKQALRQQHPLREELCLLTIHGILHLLGYDHGEQIEKGLMWSQQGAILTKLDIDSSMMGMTP